MNEEGVEGGEKLNPLPGDLIQGLVADPERHASAEEVAEILEYIARAPFNTRRVKVPAELVGEEFLGKKLGEKEDSLTTHMAQRVLNDDQWSNNTTKEDFLKDIRQAVLHPQARLVVYQTRQTNYAAVVSPNVVPPDRRGEEPCRP